jgi:hypothetical protein
MPRIFYFKIELEENEVDALPSWVLAAMQHFSLVNHGTDTFRDKEALSALACAAAAVIVEEFEDGTPPSLEDIMKMSQFMHDQLVHFIKVALEEEGRAAEGGTKH